MQFKVIYTQMQVQEENMCEFTCTIRVKTKSLTNVVSSLTNPNNDKNDQNSSHT